MGKVNEQQNRLLQQALDMLEEQALHIEAPMLPAGEELLNRIRDAIYQQAEPCEFHDCDQAACQQYSGQVPCEPAPAQDERGAEGWQLVPVEPTQAMISAGWKVGLMGMDREGPQAVYRAMLAAAPIAQTAPQHPDDASVDRFAAAMKAKLAKSRAKGRGGWDDPNVCSAEFLAQLLVEHLGKGNTGTFEDVANFAMMLHQRGADPKVLAQAAAKQPEQSGLVDAAKAFADAARKNIYPCPDKPNSLSGKLQALDGAIAAALSAIPSSHAKTGKTNP